MSYFKTSIFCCFSWFILLFLFSTPADGQASQRSFQLDGYLDSNIQGSVYLGYYSSTEKRGINLSSKIIDGRFSFRGDLFEPAVAFIRLTESKLFDENTGIVFIEPSKMHIKLSVKPFKVISLSGSKTNAEADSLNQNKIELQKKYETVLDELSNKKNGEISLELENKLEPFYKSLQQLDIDFFVSHPKSFATGHFLQFYYSKLTGDSLKMFYDLMSDSLKESIYGVNLQNEVRSKKRLTATSKAPDFTSKTDIGQIISLSDFYGKYVLLDFWAHWCIPCRQGFPRLLSQFNQYHNKGLEIIGIAEDDATPDEWERAIKKDGINLWYNILNGVKRNEDGTPDLSKSISNKYNIHLLPTKVLIDQSGKILGTYVGTENEKELEEKLKQLFK